MYIHPSATQLVYREAQRSPNPNPNSNPDPNPSPNPPTQLVYREAQRSLLEETIALVQRGCNFEEEAVSPVVLDCNPGEGEGQPPVDLLVIEEQEPTPGMKRQRVAD